MCSLDVKGVDNSGEVGISCVSPDIPGLTHLIKQCLNQEQGSLKWQWVWKVSWIKKQRKKKWEVFPNCWIQGTSAYNSSHSSPVHEIPTEVISLLISSGWGLQLLTTLKLRMHLTTSGNWCCAVWDYLNCLKSFGFTEDWTKLQILITCRSGPFAHLKKGKVCV